MNDVYSSLDNFYNQFIEVLRVRINKQDISIVKNPRLAMFNLYSAAKAIVDFQKEYELLFSEYSSLNEDFAKQELEINRKVAPLLMIQNKNIAREQIIFVIRFQKQLRR